MIQLRPPLTYYGGKQTLASLIVRLIPPHTLYAEPFAGGAAVYFTKLPSKVEVLNDVNGELMNFYQVIKNKFQQLKKEIDKTLHSRKSFYQAKIIYNYPEMFDEVKRAWAVWVICTQSFASLMNGPWGFNKASKGTTKHSLVKRNLFIKTYTNRLENTQIECADALYVIQSRDFKDAFFYLDPPYFNSNMGHYGGYTERDFEDLLQLIGQIQGKFLLSSYPSELLERYTKRYKWKTISQKMLVSVNSKSGIIKEKTEMLTANYPIHHID